MLDIKKIKENPDAVKAGLRAKEVDCDATVDRILELDTKIRTLKTNTETQTAQKNKLAKENGKLFGMKKKAEKEGKDVSELDAAIAANNAQSVQIAEAIEQELAELKERFSHAKGGGQEEALHGKEKEYGAEEQEGGALGSSEPDGEPAPKGADVPEQTWENPLA